MKDNFSAQGLNFRSLTPHKILISNFYAHRYRVTASGPFEGLLRAV